MDMMVREEEEERERESAATTTKIGLNVDRRSKRKLSRGYSKFLASPKATEHFST